MMLLGWEKLGGELCIFFVRKREREREKGEIGSRRFNKSLLEIKISHLYGRK